jgi:hypothetical protein
MTWTTPSQPRRSLEGSKQPEAKDGLKGQSNRRLKMTMPPHNPGDRHQDYFEPRVTSIEIILNQEESFS